jgi:membrane protein required for colicin V production
MSFELAWVDIVLLAVLAMSVLVGLWRGFVFEIVSLLGWVAAFVFANLSASSVSELLPSEQANAAVRYWVAYALVFVIVLIACSLLARMMRALISATPLSLLDRVLGGAFGVARGAVVLVAFATLVALSPFAHDAWWQQSRGAVWLGQALVGLKPVLPMPLNTRIDT